MATCLQGGSAVPQWYLVLEGGRIVAGAGVIENDFHDRKDLAPNVCAVYTEKDLRGRGIAGRLLEAVCADMSRCGIDTLFLLTDHTSFYERYGWEFFCMAQGEGETEPSISCQRWQAYSPGSVSVPRASRSQRSLKRKSRLTTRIFSAMRGASAAA